MMLMLQNMLLAIIVSASIDSTNLMIGSQTQLHIEATTGAKESVEMPFFTDTLIGGIEIVDHAPLRTTTLDDGRIRYQQDWTITSFEDSLYAIRPIAFLHGKDTLYSAPMSLNVLPFETDTTKQVRDIRPNYDVPFWWWGLIRWILLGLGCLIVVAGLIILGIYLYRRYHHKEIRLIPHIERPAEEIAIEELNRIKMEKIWQTGHEKRYHTELTDVVRSYISNRFNVSSTEKTSDETLREMKPLLKQRPDVYSELERELHLADLIKFAKWKATPEENEMALRSAYHFVHETTPPAEEKTNDVTTKHEEK